MRYMRTILIAAILAFVFTGLGIALPDQQGQISYFDANDNFVGAVLWGCSSYDLTYYGDTSGDKTLTWTDSCDQPNGYLSCDTGQTPVYYDHNTAPSYCASQGWIDCYHTGYCGHSTGYHPDQW